MGKKDVIPVSKCGVELLRDPVLNKGTHFSEEERTLFHLHGLLPPHVADVDEQLRHVYEAVAKKRSPLGKYNFLQGLSDRNQTLFYLFLEKHAKEMLPIIYTPTVGEAALEYSEIYAQPRGLYFSYPFLDQMDEIFAQYHKKEIQVIVVTDGERVLGLGDQGVGGMTIPIGKLSLYTLFGGIHPEKTLPILIDAGTNNPDLLKNEFYVGWRHQRLSGEKYDAFLHEFVRCVKKHFPHALLQWEDFGKTNARRLLDCYRKEILSFNDDIQGTASVVLAALLSALKKSKEKISNQRIAILGGGSAGTGIADMLIIAMQQEGLSKEEACRRIYIIDIDGLIHFNTKTISEGQKPYVQPRAFLKDWKLSVGSSISLMDVVVNAHPSVLIGVSAQSGAFNQKIIAEMARYTKHPIVFPLSNPTTKAECTPQELIEWTDAKAIIATGSPFDPVVFNGKTFSIAQCNNVYIFPGVGSGAVAAKAKEVTEGMFLVAAHTLAEFSPALKDSAASLFPPIEKVREVSREIAINVGKQAIEEGVSHMKFSEITQHVDELMWTPHYPKIICKK